MRQPSREDMDDTTQRSRSGSRKLTEHFCFIIAFNHVYIFLIL